MNRTLQQFETQTFSGEQILDKTIELLGGAEVASQQTVNVPMDSNNQYLEVGEHAAYHRIERNLESPRNMSKGLNMRKTMVKLALLHEIMHFSGPSRSLVLDTEKTIFRADLIERDVIGGFDLQVSGITYTAESLLDDNRDESMIHNLGRLLILGQDPRTPQRPAGTKKRMFEGFNNNIPSFKRSVVREA